MWQLVYPQILPTLRSKFPDGAGLGDRNSDLVLQLLQDISSHLAALEEKAGSSWQDSPAPSLSSVPSTVVMAYLPSWFMHTAVSSTTWAHQHCPWVSLGNLHVPISPSDAWLGLVWGQGTARGTSSPNWLGQQLLVQVGLPGHPLVRHGFHMKMCTVFILRFSPPLSY